MPGSISVCEVHCLWWSLNAVSGTVSAAVWCDADWNHHVVSQEGAAGGSGGLAQLSHVSLHQQHMRGSTHVCDMRTVSDAV
jgi:hypothetical protein